MLKFAWLQLLLLSFFLSACTEESAKNKSDSAKPAAIPRLSQLTGVELAPKTPFVSIDDELAFLFSDKTGLVFQKGSKKTIVKAGGSAPSRLWLQSDGAYVYALWWEKFGLDDKGVPVKGKQLFVSASKDKGENFSPATVISNEYGVLPTVKIASDPSGKIIVTYHDERAGLFQVHANLSIDGGKTWLAHDVRVDQDLMLPKVVGTKDNAKISSTAVQPFVFLVDNGQKGVVLWQQIDKLNGVASLNIKSRTYDFNKASWSEVQTVYRNESESGVIYSAAQYQNNLVVMVSLDGQGVVSSLSTDSGQSWVNLGSNYKKGALTEKGHPDFLQAMGAGDKIYVWETLTRDSPKTKIMLSTISLTKKTWLGEPRQFGGENRNLTNYGRQVPGKLADGTMMVMWTDYRNIVPAVYVDISKDQGETWLNHPKILSTPGYHNVSFVKLVTGDKKAWVISSLLELKGKKTVNSLAYQTITQGVDGKLSFSDVPIDRIRLSKEEMEDRLKKRVAEFWKLRKGEKWMATWDYFDPVYRLKFGKKQWLQTQGKLIFGDYKLKEINVPDADTVFATAVGEVEVAIHTQTVEEGILEAAPFKKQVVPGKWGWFYDDWYLMPDVFFTQIHDY